MCWKYLFYSCLKKQIKDEFRWNLVWAVQKHVNSVDLVKRFLTSISLQKSASIQLGTSLSKLGGDPIHSFIRILRYVCWILSFMHVPRSATSPPPIHRALKFPNANRGSINTTRTTAALAARTALCASARAASKAASWRWLQAWRSNTTNPERRSQNPRWNSPWSIRRTSPKPTDVPSHSLLRRFSQVLILVHRCSTHDSSSLDLPPMLIWQEEARQVLPSVYNFLLRFNGA